MKNEILNKLRPWQVTRLTFLFSINYPRLVSFTNNYGLSYSMLDSLPKINKIGNSVPPI